MVECVSLVIKHAEQSLTDWAFFPSLLNIDQNSFTSLTWMYKNKSFL